MSISRVLWEDWRVQIQKIRGDLLGGLQIKIIPRTGFGAASGHHIQIRARLSVLGALESFRSTGVVFRALIFVAWLWAFIHMS